MRYRQISAALLGLFVLLGACDAQSDPTPSEDGTSGDRDVSLGEPACPEACENGGTCVDGACVCAAGFAGPSCAFPDPCEPNPCQNGGTCALDADGGAVCTCLEGFEGSDCSDGSLVRVDLAALYLNAPGDAVWDVEVRGPDAAVVWQVRLSSSLYGDSAGSASYVGPCAVASGEEDATNEVRVWVVGVYDDDITSPGGFNTPVEPGTAHPLAYANATWSDENANGIRDLGDIDAPLERSFACRPHADVFVQFDVALDMGVPE